jgi:hypothetical protein
MTTISLKSNRNIVFITAIALIIFLGGTFMLHLVPAAAKNKIANGLLADFMITFPVLFYLIIVRPLKVPLKSMILVFSLCCAVAYLLLPAHQREYILQVRKLTALAEVGFIIYAAAQFNKIRAAYKIHHSNFADRIYNLRAAMADVLGDSLPIKTLASELAVLRYGLLFWRKEKTNIKESTAFSTHKESGYIALWGIFLFAVMVEIVAFHFLLMKWSHVAALIVTLLSSYGIILFVADLSAIVKRKVLIAEDQLILRLGLRWRAITSLDNVRSITKISYDHKSEEAYFKGGVTKGSGNVLISFKGPVKVDKLYGQSKAFNSILMNVDDISAFANIVNNPGSFFPHQ